MRLSSALRLDRVALLLVFAAALVALLAVAPHALADPLTPESGGSPQAERIDTLYKLVLYIAILVFVAVEGALIYSLFTFRKRRGGPEAAQIHGNTPLELGWTAGAALVLVALTTITFIYLGDIENPPSSDPGGLDSAQGAQFASINQDPPPDGKQLAIGVNGQQYLWRYDYPGKPRELYSYHEMVVPIRTTVTLKIRSTDVAHSWWIPKLGGKFDAIPGHTNETWFKIEKPGTYDGQCAELCGPNHADMLARVRALPVAEYQRWAARQRSDIRESQERLAASRLAREPSEGETGTAVGAAPEEDGE